MENPIRRCLAWGKALGSPGRRRRTPAQPVTACAKAAQPARAWQPPCQLEELPHEEMGDVIKAIVRPYVQTYGEWQQALTGAPGACPGAGEGR